MKKKKKCPLCIILRGQVDSQPGSTSAHRKQISHIPTWVIAGPRRKQSISNPSNLLRRLERRISFGGRFFDLSRSVTFVIGSSY